MHTKTQKLQFMLRLMCTKLWFPHRFECPLLRNIMGFEKSMRGQLSDTILSITQLDIEQCEKPLKVLCSIDITNLIMLDLLSKFEKKILVFWVYLYFHESLFFPPISWCSQGDDHPQVATFNTCTWNNYHGFIYYNAKIYIIRSWGRSFPFYFKWCVKKYLVQLIWIF
jgi:hypothetical protein